MEFTIEYRRGWGNYCPVSFIKDFYNRDVGCPLGKKSSGMSQLFRCGIYLKGNRKPKK